MPLRIEDYALIGDCETAALVGRDGSVDWLCWPRFDSGACFASLLGTPAHGRWLLAPQGEYRSSRRYRGHSLVLETEFDVAGGRVRVIDFMPLRGEASDLIRIAVGLSGQVSMRMELALRFDYGRIKPWVEPTPDGRIIARAGPDLAALQTDVPVTWEDGTISADFTLRTGNTMRFVLTYQSSHQPPPNAVEADEAVQETEAFWTRWASVCQYGGPYHDAVVRSPSRSRP